MPGFVPKPCAWDQYWDEDSPVYFFLGDFYDMEIQKAPEPEDFAAKGGELVPEPERFAAKVAELHIKGNSPTGKFGFFVPTACGIFERTVKWESSWTKCCTNQVQDVIRYDNETNGIWPQFDAACKQVIDAVIPRLLGVLQSGGRSIKPALIHSDLREQNVGIDNETRETIVFDPGCTYAHNEMEFGTWRCSWARQFRVPIYMELYQRYIKPSDPQSEWDDRNRLYSLPPYLNDSAGHPGSISRSMCVLFYRARPI
ncbi:Fructosamine/Ketosamine-3-kinase [Penicillium malachiteum]|uniref:Fructosamine/Ketosamine-3-kinase n=1 Tax=Penicillium malachiteum TaxID=1324776 RepID=UPI0025493D3D|nr:Fructosamine/Ketosamine-3-kinase [Penicillium malachiteum]KAJ5713880.1 Fructosamine/Ketosamine-3-kinase [Penicillium malachiteum]